MGDQQSTCVMDWESAQQLFSEQRTEHGLPLLHVLGPHPLQVQKLLRINYYQLDPNNTSELRASAIMEYNLAASGAVTSTFS